MSYYTGTANDMAAVRAALVAACTGEGWAWDAGTEVLSKGTVFVRLQVAAGFLTLLGRTSATTGNAPNIVQMGPFTGGVLTPIAWPVTYRVFVFEQEVYLVIKHSVVYFQWLAFGKSTVDGLPGTGTWVAATGSIQTFYTYSIVMSATTGGTGNGPSIVPAPFWSIIGNVNSCFIHSDLDGQSWYLSADTNLTSTKIGVGALVPLIGLLPNAWNSEAVLLPIRAWKQRPSSMISRVAELENARYTSVANYDPEQIITIGVERWMVFPFWKKSAGNISYSDDSGSLGWAIRYEGP